MGVKFLPFSSDPRAAAALCPPLSPPAGGTGQGARSLSWERRGQGWSHLVPPRRQTQPLDTDGLEMRRERRGQLETRLSPEPCCAVPFRAVLSRGEPWDEP